MPLYVFRCPRCGATVQRLQSYDDPAPRCLHVEESGCCGTRRVRVEMERQISAPAHFDLRGPGFYANDYGTNSG